MGHWGDTPGGSGGSGSGGGFGSSGLESRQSDFRPGETDSIDNKLRGFGRGRARGGKTAISVVGFESSGCEFGSGGGFGGGQSNGFNDNNNNKGFDGEESKRYGEGDLGACGGGFQSSGWGGGGRGSRDGAFGGSGGGGGDSRGGGFRGRAGDGGGSRGGGFGGSDEGFRGRVGDNEGRRGGGFGGSGGGGGSRACFKCGEEGHMSRDCPSGGGGGASRPSSGASINSEIGGIGRNGGRCGGGKDPGCHKCGELGHFARECPKAMAYGEKPKEIYIPPEPSNIEEEIFMHSMEKGINFNKFDDIPVECSGMDPPTSGIQRFEQMELNEIMKRNIVHAGYDRPTPIQKWAIPSILAGRDIMACAQTGSGKTAAFLVPVLTSMIEHGVEGSAFSEIQEPQAIVVGPTRELVVQTFKEARKFSYNTMIKPVVVYGGASVRHQMFKVAGGAHIVMGTPGRLIDFLKAGKISLRKLRYLVLDEADRMLDMGFLPQLQQIVQDFGMPGKTVRQTLMFSATFPENIQMLAQEYLNNYLFVTVGRVGGANTDIEQVVHPVPTFEKRDKIVSLLNQTSADKTLVFVGTKRQADYLASFLSQSEFPTTSIHGDREQREREEALADFKSGRAPVMVATSVAARGLDIPDVKHVINFDMPSEIDEYIHRIGRTGRCGNLGKATSFFNPESDGAIARGLVNKLEEAHQVVPAFLEEAAVRSYGTGGFTGGGGQYASKDTRKYRRGGGGSNLEGGGHSNGFGGGSMGGFGGGGGGDADEDWD